MVYPPIPTPWHVSALWEFLVTLPPSLVESLFPEQVFVFLFEDVCFGIQFPPVPELRRMQVSAEIQFTSPLNHPVSPNSIHPRRYTTLMHAELVFHFHIWMWTHLMQLRKRHTFPVAYFLKRFFSFHIRDFNNVIFLFERLCFPGSQGFLLYDVELLRTASLFHYVREY